jgi:hypothetical protein
MIDADDYHFLQEGSVEMNAAVVGVAKSRWAHLHVSEATPERALELMREGHFDVIPVQQENGQVKDYFHAKSWGDYSAAVRSKIHYRDVMPLQTPVREVIRAFVHAPGGGRRSFYFLSNEGRIAGLVSVANLNSRQVQVYLFSLLCELEDRMSALVRRMGIPDAEILRVLRGDQLRRYENDLRAGLDEHVLEYLYFLDLFRLIRRKRLYVELGYDSEEEFKRLEDVNALRNNVAHPVKSLVTRSNTVERLLERLELVEDALFRLRNYDVR